MAKKKASLAGRGAEILFGGKPSSASTEAPAEEATGVEEMESNQQGGTESVGESAPGAMDESARTLAGEVGAEHPAPVPPVLPPGSVVIVGEQSLPKSVLPRPYDFAPPSEQPGPLPKSATPQTYFFPPPSEMEAATPSAPKPGQPFVPPLPSAPTSPSQPASIQGGNVSSPSTPPKPTVVAQPITSGPIIVSPPAPSSSSPISVTPPTPASGGILPMTPSAPVSAPVGAPSAVPATTSVIPGKPAIPQGGVIPTPPSLSGAGIAPAAGGTPMPWSVVSEALRMVASEREAAEQAKKEKELAPVNEEEVKKLRQTLYDSIQVLYNEVAECLRDTPLIREQCFTWLKEARLLILNGKTAGDVSTAENLIAKVSAKLKRTGEPIPKEEVRNVVLILIWTFAFLLFCLPMAVSFLYENSTVPFVNLKLSANIIPFFAAFGWGGIGGVIGTLYNMVYFIQQREYDPAYNLDYVVRPLKGLIAGGILILIFTFGSTFAPVSGQGGATASGDYRLAYLIAVLGGFKQEVIFDWFDAILKAALRTTATKADTSPK